MRRYDRYREPIEPDEAQPRLPFAGEPAASGVAAPVHRKPPLCCELCGCKLLPANASGWCRECSLLVSARLRVTVEERWRDLGDGEHIVSQRGRVARLLNVDTAHRYPRVSVGGEKRYLRALVAEAWHGPRPDGLLALHYDDDPDNPSAENIRWGTPAENAADAKRNRGSA